MDIYSLIKPIAFNFDPESIHHSFLKMAELAPQIANILPHVPSNERYKLSTSGLNWSFPIGLAAGLDKEAQAVDFFSNLGFGAIEIGTVTPKPQAGNPLPRIWRYPKEQNLRNAMGFPNLGMEKIVTNIQKQSSKTCLGINIGKNKNTTENNVIDDYKILYQNLARHGNYMVINVSSPNTPGLRKLQNEKFLNELLTELLPLRTQYPLPLFIKISPDMTPEQTLSVINIAKQNNIAGIVATNTTVDHSYDSGGLSGKCLQLKSRDIRKYILDNLNESNLTLIGVGGISEFKDLYGFWLDGGKLAQVFTAFIYQGPKILKDFSEKIDLLLKESQAQNLEDLLSNRNELKNLSQFV